MQLPEKIQKIGDAFLDTMNDVGLGVADKVAVLYYVVEKFSKSLESAATILRLAHRCGITKRLAADLLFLTAQGFSEALKHSITHLESAAEKVLPATDPAKGFSLSDDYHTNLQRHLNLSQAVDGDGRGE